MEIIMPQFFKEITGAQIGEAVVLYAFFMLMAVLASVLA
jgi:hypothetical protein